jgi:dipeptidyl aminopeptidase/acylaminoacyl peptidase
MTKIRMLMVAVALAWAIPIQTKGQPTEAPETVVVQSGGLTLRGLLWRPSGRGPFPAVLFSHGSGPAAYPQKPAALGPAFVRHGYVFLYLFRRGAGLSADQGTNSEELMSRALREKGQDARNELQMQLLETELSDVLGGLAFLRALPDVDTDRVAVAGHSFGASLTLLIAERDSALRAAIAFSGSAASWEHSPQLRARLIAAVRRTTVPIFFIQAENDYSIAPAKTLSAEMERLGKPHRIKIYPSIGQTAIEGHDFYYLGLSIWEPDVFAFLDERTRP